MEWVLPIDQGVHEASGNAHRVPKSGCFRSKNMPIATRWESAAHSPRPLCPCGLPHAPFDKMIAWYQAVFDCRVQYQNPGLAFLTYDDGHHRVAIIKLAAVLPDASKDERRGVIGVDVVVYTYGSVEDPAPCADPASPRWITLRPTCLTDGELPPGPM
jgi:hypothetical protein